MRDLTWDKQKAITTPPKAQKPIKEWVELAKSNGIAYPTLQKRINILNWEPERAATEPLCNRKKYMAELGRAGRVYPIELIEQAANNGIAYNTLRQRIKCDWSVEDAATTPTNGRARKANPYWAAINSLLYTWDKQKR